MRFSPFMFNRPFLFVVSALVLIATSAIAQFGPFRGGGGGMFRERPQAEPDRSEYPTWKLEPAFKSDVFTFVRIRYNENGYGRRGRFGGWRNDYPDCDWNFSARLQQLTAFNVDPDGRVLALTDPELFDYPFIYMSNPGALQLSDDEAIALRKYLLNGGFLMADDFWAAAEWRHLAAEMKVVLPNCEPRELPLSHEIFHAVYDLKEMPRVPSIHAWRQGDIFEHWHGDTEGDEASHFQAYFDEGGRMMALFCHNNDIGDGWEREGEEREYFERFSEKVSYPLGINIITYVMTH